MDDMPCQELVELVTDYLEGVLGSDETLRIKQHLGLCDGCERYVAQINATIRATATLRCQIPDPLVEKKLTEIHRQWMESRFKK